MEKYLKKWRERQAPTKVRIPVTSEQRRQAQLDQKWERLFSGKQDAKK